MSTLYLIDLDRPLGKWYVIATDPSAAYDKLRQMLDNADYGYRDSRRLKTIDVVAQEHNHFGDDQRLIL